MAITDRNLRAGTALVARYRGTAYRAEVVETEEGLRYRLEDGREFRSLSSVGSAVMGGKAVNGWRFWSTVDEAPDATGPAAKPAARAGRAKKDTQTSTSEAAAPSG